MRISRRQFVGGMAASCLAGGCVTEPPWGQKTRTYWRNPDGELLYGLLVHFGRNLWGPKDSADHVRFDKNAYHEVTARMKAVGANMLVLDLAEACQYPSHPELAVSGTWSVCKMRDELSRLRDMGIEPIPKLNFSSSHDLWMKEYSRMRSTDVYYRVVSDLIRDVCELFESPRFFHLGWDEEKEKIQKLHEFPIITFRRGDLWWHDMLFTVDEVKKYGCRAWIWSDKEWKEKDEFLKRCPRDIIQSHWYYSSGFGCEWESRDDKKINEEPWAEPYTLCVYKELEDAGFKQIPCGSNIYNAVNFPGVVQHCLKTISRQNLIGFLNAPWCEMARLADQKDGLNRYLAAVDQLGAARKVVMESGWTV